MATRDSVFTPLTAQDLEGPFSGFLKPPEQQQTQMPPAALSTGGGIAMAATAFLDSATKGRIKAYEMRENEKSGKIAALNSRYAEIMNDPEITPAAKKQAGALYWQAMGRQMGEAQQGQGKGKGGKNGDQKQSLVHHAISDLTSGLTGGKNPKGLPDVGDALAQMQTLVYDHTGEPKPQFNLKSQTETAMQGLRGILPKDVTSQSQEQVMQSVQGSKEFKTIESLVGFDEATKRLGVMLTPYQPAPATGSPAAVAAGLMKGLQQPQAGAAAPPEPVKTSVPVNYTATPKPGAASASVAPGPPEAPQFDRTRSMLYEYAKLGSIDTPKNVERLGAKGNVEQRATAYYVNNPDFSGWVDAGTQQPLPGNWRISSTAEPKQERFSTPQTVKGDPSWGGDPKKWYRVQKSEDDPSNVHIVGEVNDPSKGRTVAPRPVTPQMQAAQRKMAVMDAMSKVLSQTPPPKDAKGVPLRGMAEAQYYLDHIQQFYQKDKSVGPYLADLKDWLTTEARKESFKEPGDVKKMLQDATGKAQQDVNQQEQIQAIQHTVQDGMDELWGIQSAAGGEDPENIR